MLSIAGLVAATSLAFVTGGLGNPALTSIGSSLAVNFLTKLTPDKIKKWFIDVHPNELNHHIKKMFIESIKDAINNISVLFTETQATKNEKKEAKQLIKTLQNHLSATLLDSKQIQLDETEVKHFLYEKEQEDDICNFIKNKFDVFGITEPFKSFLAQNLSAQVQLCFGENLKKPANQNAWIAFQRMLTEEIRNDIKQIAGTQQSIKDDLSDLKFEKSGLSEEQISEIRQLIKILNDKKLVEVKINDGINQSLQSIEVKANQIIQITTKTQLTVDELKNIIRRQNKKNHIIFFSLAGCLVMASAFVIYTLINQPFTATIQIYGWESKQHNPLDGIGMMVLTLGNKTEKSEISRNGEAVFKGIPPEYNGKNVPIHLTDTENEPYYLTDSMIQICKDKKSEIQVLLHGLNKLQGQIFDETGITGLSGVQIRVAGEETTTDEWGHFLIDIPPDKLKRVQLVESKKQGYKPDSWYFDMTGKFEKKLKPQQ